MRPLALSLEVKGRWTGRCQPTHLRLQVMSYGFIYLFFKIIWFFRNSWFMSQMEDRRIWSWACHADHMIVFFNMRVMYLMPGLTSKFGWRLRASKVGTCLHSDHMNISSIFLFMSPMQVNFQLYEMSRWHTSKHYSFFGIF